MENEKAVNDFFHKQKLLADTIDGLKDTIRGLEAKRKELLKQQGDASSKFSCLFSSSFKSWSDFIATYKDSLYYDGDKMYFIDIDSDTGGVSFVPAVYFGKQIKEMDDDDYEDNIGDDGGKEVYLAIAYGRDIVDAAINYLRLFPDECIPFWTDTFQIDDSQARIDGIGAAVIATFQVPPGVDIYEAIERVDQRLDKFCISGGLIEANEVQIYLDTDLSIDQSVKRHFGTLDYFETLSPISLKEKIKETSHHLEMKLLDFEIQIAEANTIFSKEAK